MSDNRLNLLRQLSDPGLDPFFIEASRIGVESAWFGHVPFAHWLVSACAPQLLVELGTHNGVSYSAFCDAIVSNGLVTRAVAIDSWEGDAQAGFYGDEVYDDFRAFHDPRYSAFSSLIRTRFDDALHRFDDGSIDLLHIDGEHSYAAVRHDFENWRPKLSDAGIVLFHDTQVRQDGYGVWQLWAELREEYPGFEFLHANGLGILGVGSKVPAPAAALLNETRREVIERIQERFRQLGARWQREAEIRLLEPRLEDARLAAHRGERTANQAEAALRRTLEEVQRLEGALRSAQDAEPAHFRITLVKMQKALDEAQRERQAMLDSTIWRATGVLRRLAGLVPQEPRRKFRLLLRRGSRAIAPVHQPVVPARVPRRKSKAASVAPKIAGTSSSTVLTKRHSVAGEAGLRDQPTGQVHRIVFISGEPDIPGHIYRVEHYANAFSAAGASVWWIPIDEIEYRLAEIATATIVVIWRTVNSPAVEQLVEAVRLAGALLVFDIDDLMFRPELASAKVIDAIRTQNLCERDIASYYQQVQDVLVQADVCFTSTEDLAVQAQRFGLPTYVLRNGFDAETLRISRLAARRWRMQQSDESRAVRRIGYAAGTRTHQNDFREAAGAIARVLSERPDCRLVLFRSQDGTERMFDPAEFSAFKDLGDQIEWRDVVPLEDLPNELARFDINIAPLEIYNPFVEAKSELKYFEAALVSVPTIASPTGPMRRAIRDRETGRLARSEEDWYVALTELLDDPSLRRKLAHAALLDVVWRFGPERRAKAARSVLHQLDGGPDGAHAFELEWRRASMPRPTRQPIPEADTIFEADQLGCADVSVVIPLYNYSRFVIEALDSVRHQSIAMLDLIVVDDGSTDDSLAVALDWARQHAGRFNRLLVLRNHENSGLSLTRNLGFDRAETPFVLPLDADNRLLKDCVARCLQALTDQNLAFAYPLIRNFGDSDHIIGDKAYSPMRLAAANFIDAMAMVRKSTWVAVGGFAPIRFGWEDYDFWCRCAEQGFLGVQVEEVLAEYRFHDGSMLRTTTDIPANKAKVIEQLEQLHRWLRLPREDVSG